MQEYQKVVQFKGRMVILGCGSIGQGVLPLLLRHIEMSPQQVLVVAADERGRDVVEKHGVSFRLQVITRQNYQAFLDSVLREGDLLLNLSINVGSCEVVEFCAKKKGAVPRYLCGGMGGFLYRCGASSLPAVKLCLA